MTLRNLFPLFVLLVVFVAASCTQKKQEEGDGEHHAASADAWKEMDDFHMVMAESFHPYKDSAYLDPAIKNSTSLVAAAENWAKAPLPDRVDNDDTKARLKELTEATVAFADIANSGDPDKIGESLTALHDLFHELQETWYGAAAEHDEHH
jgi:hypothetical protein